VKGEVRGVHIIGSKDLHAFLEGLPAWMSERLSTRIIDCLLSNQYSYRNRMPKPKVVTDTIASVPTDKLVVSPTLKH